MIFENTFNELIKISWNNATSSFYTAKRRLVSRNALYEIKQVNIDQSLQEKMRSIIMKQVNDVGEVSEYDFNTVDLDNNLLAIKVAETDMKKIMEILSDENALPMISSYEELIGSWIYITRLEDSNNNVLYAFRRVSDTWSTKKVKSFLNLVYSNHMLVNLEEKEVFKIDETIDFFSFNEVVFIANKKNFEHALNFREGMVQDRDNIVEEFKNLKLFVDPTIISNLVGDNIKRLRKLSQIKKSGYYKQSNFLENLKKANANENWGINYSNDEKIIVNEENIDTILTVFNNSRLKSPINEESFDVDVKRKLN